MVVNRSENRHVFFEDLAQIGLIWYQDTLLKEKAVRPSDIGLILET